MPLYLIHRTEERLRRPDGAHCALVEAVDPAAARTAANALVPGANGPFDLSAVTEVAPSASGGFVPTFFDGDARNLLGMTRGGGPA